MNISSILPPEAVLPQLEARDKKSTLKALAATAAEISGLDAREIYPVLLEREHMGCTGIGSGVCIPHGRFDQLRATHAVFARLTHPIEFGAADGKPVDLIFLLLTPAGSNTDHLKAMASLSRLLRDKKLCASLRKTGDAAALHAMLTADRNEDAA